MCVWWKWTKENKKNIIGNFVCCIHYTNKQALFFFVIAFYSLFCFSAFIFRVQFASPLSSRIHLAASNILYRYSTVKIYFVFFFCVFFVWRWCVLRNIYLFDATIYLTQRRLQVNQSTVFLTVFHGRNKQIQPPFTVCLLILKVLWWIDGERKDPFPMDY